VDRSAVARNGDDFGIRQRKFGGSALWIPDERQLRAGRAARRSRAGSSRLASQFQGRSRS